MSNITLKQSGDDKEQLESLEPELSSSDDFVERLNKCAELAGSMNALARLSGMSQSGMRRYFIGGEPTRPVLVAVARAVNVSLVWLSTGEGEMRLSQDKEYPGHNQPFKGHDLGERAAYVVEKEESADWTDFSLIPYYDVEASAGHGAVVGEELQISQLAFRKDWLTNKGLQKDKLVTIKAKGDSMEPTLYDGDLLLVDTRIEKIIDDSIYIVQADHHLIVKRVQQSLDGSLSIISDNARYKEQHLSPDQAKALKIAGRVCWYSHEI